MCACAELTVWECLNQRANASDVHICVSQGVTCVASCDKPQTVTSQNHWQDTDGEISDEGNKNWQ